MGAGLIVRPIPVLDEPELKKARQTAGLFC
jgi:hypothetical protein